MRPSRGLTRSGMMITNAPGVASIHGMHFNVRPVSFGTDGSGGGGSSFWRQQQARDSAVTPQQHDNEVAQAKVGFTPSRSMHGPLACATGVNPVAAMATSSRSVVATFRFLCRRNMASSEENLTLFSAMTHPLSRLFG